VPNREATSSRRNKLLKATLYLLFLLVLQETVLRAFFPFPELKHFNRIDYIIGDIPGQGRSYARNIDLVMRSYPDTVADFVNRLNYYGFRDGRWRVDKSEDRTRVVFVGDSFVEGNMAPAGETIPESFRRRAGTEGARLEVMNFGISSGDWITYSRLVSHVSALFEPDEIILVIFANDMLDQPEFRPDPPPSPERFDRRRPRLLEILSLIQRGEAVPSRWNLRDVFFTWNSPDASIPEEATLRRSVHPEIADAIRDRTFNSGLINWPLNAEGFLRRPYEPAPMLRTLKASAETHGARLHVAYIPLRSQVTNHYYQFEKRLCGICPQSLDLTRDVYQTQRRILAAASEQLGIPFHDLSDPIRSEELNGNHLYWNYDMHMKAEGYRMVGEWLFDWWSDGR
jgi:lysophospholipase L1-like esterase